MIQGYIFDGLRSYQRSVCQSGGKRGCFCDVNSDEPTFISLPLSANEEILLCANTKSL